MEREHSSQQSEEPNTEAAFNASAPLSPKRSHFELVGQEFLITSGYGGLFGGSKTRQHYPEIRESWLKAIPGLNFGTPNLETKSLAEQEQLELFFIELRHGDRASTLNKYASLIQSRSNDEDFWNALTGTLDNRKIASNAEPSLSYYLVCGWLHSFFWGLSNTHRAWLLDTVYGVSPGISEDTIRKTATQIGLKDWSHFRHTYQKPPFVLKLFQEGQHRMCQILLNRHGQS
jgi:hypothetical protein